MADSTFYEEDDLLSSLAAPQYAGQDQASYEEEYKRMQELEKHAHAQHGEVAQADGELGVQLEMVHEDVKRFLVLFHQAIIENDLTTITSMYESGWNKLTQAHYAQSEWPEAEVIAPLVQNDQVFLTLYRELYFRHVYARLQPTIDDRFQSYENICELFNYLLNSEGPVPLELPIQWLWDMLDEFVYQFQSFAQWRSNPKNKSEEELDLLSEAQQIWSSYSVLNVLYSLVQKSGINEQLKAEREGKSAEEVAELAGEYGSKSLYRNLGYFSLICLLRVHVLLGDPTLALQSVENVEFAPGSLLTRITACHVTTYYHVGCAYMALSRWTDATRIFVTVLIYFLRMKQMHTRSYQYGSIAKQCERMYALVAICHSLAPGPTDESILSTVKEHHADQMAIMQRGGDDALSTYKDLFLSACPKYLSVNPPPYEDNQLLEAYVANPPQDATARYVELFLADVVAVKGVQSIRNLLKLYTSIDAGKLSAFVGEEAGEEEVLQQLMALKAASRSYQGKTGGSLLDGERASINNLDFTIEGSMVHVEETITNRRLAGYLIRNTEHAQRALHNIRSSPLPTTGQQTTERQPRREGQTGGGGHGQGSRGGQKPNGQQEGKPAAWQSKNRVRVAA